MLSLPKKFLTIYLVTCWQAVFSADVYVAINGSNSNAGDAPGYTSAYATIAHAISQMSYGDTCYIQAGTYHEVCLLYTSPSPRDRTRSRMPSSA